MNIRSILASVGALALMAALPAQAASISLQPSQAVVQQTLGFTVDLQINATDAPGTHPGLYGGGVIIDFDPAQLTYTPGSLSLAGGVSFYEPLTVGSSGGRQTLTFGFNNAPDVGTVATLAFTAIGPVGSTPTINIVDGDDFSGSFASYVPTYQRFYPNFTGTSVEISAVPLPGAAWLVVTAFGALLAQARRRQAPPRGR